MKYKNIVWDWNGTLLDDVKISVETINRMLRNKQLEGMTLERYKSVFGFPVKDYYEGIGFDFGRDNWEQVSLEFVDTYDQLSKDVVLTQDIIPVLAGVRETGVRQYILSALQENLLNEMLERFNIRDYFDGVCGSNNIYADGKIARGEQMLQAFPINPAETLMIGDTLHDAEVAEALGFDVRLYAGGHNSVERLLEKAPVLMEMTHVLSVLKNGGH